MRNGSIEKSSRCIVHGLILLSMEGLEIWRLYLQSCLQVTCWCKLYMIYWKLVLPNTAFPRSAFLKLWSADHLWSFKKDRRKNKIQMSCVLHYNWKSQSLEMTHGNRLSLYNGALQIIIQFVSTYLCEKEFSSLILIKTKYRNRVYACGDLRIKLTSIHPNIEQLCKNPQAHPFH